ncbi:MAG: type VI secretion system contractile sheath large subunit, partial [Providencia sp.]|nr:type VI secretion system contractile sheath large subunit [Providencia sp.]
MLMSVNNETTSNNTTTVLDDTTNHGIYASLFEKINLTPVTQISDINAFQDNAALADTTADERVTVAVQVFLDRLKSSGQQVERLDRNLLDHHIAELDKQISQQLDEVMHHTEFQQVESTWRGLKFLVDRTDFRQNVKIELLDVSKDDLRQDFEDSPEVIQSGLYQHTYIAEYD